MKILLISGHGAGDPGAIGTYQGKQYKEADLTREVTAALAKVLKPYADVTIYDTDRNAYTDYKNGGLTSRAKFQTFDYVLEVHFNAFQADAGDGRNKGTEIFVMPSRSDVSVEKQIVDAIAKVGLTNRGVKKQSFGVISTASRAGVRASLLEVCFIDDADDMRIYTTKTNQIVSAIKDGIVDGLGMKATANTKDAIDVTVQNAVEDIGMDMPDYWDAVLRGKRTATPANIKALMDKYHAVLVKKK